MKKEISSKITESINFSIEIKKNIKESEEFSKLSSLMNSDFQNKFINQVNFNLLNSLFLTTLFFVISTIVLFMIIFQYKSRLITEGDILAILVYSGTVMNNVNFIVNYINEYIKSFTLIGDTEKLLQHTPENYTEGKISKKVEGNIEFKNLSFNY
ncbi:MAG TPA: ABC transporter ATP-binding protein, partial [Candidatus Pacebacteria bacterium]|nr:ABC transporter ATP-binding protein [Candidatus Paceibacterota bacterium]